MTNGYCVRSIKSNHSMNSATLLIGFISHCFQEHPCLKIMCIYVYIYVCVHMYMYMYMHIYIYLIFIHSNDNV